MILEDLCYYDWVMYKNQPMRIERIDGRFIDLVDLANREEECIRIEDIEPIILTTSLLYNNGFENIKLNYFVNSEFPFGLYNDGLVFYPILPDETIIYGIELRSVDQLQKLLRCYRRWHLAKNFKIN